jgi:hypothetical protein
MQIDEKEATFGNRGPETLVVLDIVNHVRTVNPNLASNVKEPRMFRVLNGADKPNPTPGTCKSGHLRLELISCKTWTRNPKPVIHDD